MLKRINEPRLEEDTLYRVGYLSEFMGFAADDIAAIHGAASHLGDRPDALPPGRVPAGS